MEKLQLVFYWACFWQCDDPSKLKDTDTYTSLPASPAELNPAYGTTQGNVFFRKSDKEILTIETLLCSTKITQNSKSIFIGDFWGADFNIFISVTGKIPWLTRRIIDLLIERVRLSCHRFQKLSYEQKWKEKPVWHICSSTDQYWIGLF